MVQKKKMYHTHTFNEKLYSTCVNKFVLYSETLMVGEANAFSNKIGIIKG